MNGSDKSNKNKKFIQALSLIISVVILIFICIKSNIIEHPVYLPIDESQTAEPIITSDILQTSEPEQPAAVSDPDQPDSTERSPDSEIAETTNPPTKVTAKTYKDQYDRLRDQYGNNNIIGIIKIPDTTVYYPVAGNPPGDNNYYLERNLYNRKDSAGSICMDYENNVDNYDPNTILYGHQMYSESMFHTISYYTDENFFKNHRYVIFNTIYEDNVWEVFSFFKTSIDFYYIKVRFKSESEFLDLAAEMKKRSLYGSGIEIKEGDRILTLSTCTNEDPDTRYVLCARMVKNKDDIPPDIAEQMTKAAENFK